MAEEADYAEELKRRVDEAFAELRVDLDEVIWKKVNALEEDILDVSKEFLSDGKLDEAKIINILSKAFASNVKFLTSYFEWEKVKTYFIKTAKKTLKEAEEERLQDIEDTKEYEIFEKDLKDGKFD